MNAYKYKSAEFVADISQGIGVGEVTGVVTLDVAGQLIATSNSLMFDYGACSQIVSYRGAAVLTTSEELFSKAAGIHTACETVPTALVVSVDQLEMFREYCRLAMHAGIEKAAFLTIGEAQRWAGVHAQIHAWRMEHLGRLQSAVARTKIPASATVDRLLYSSAAGRTDAQAPLCRG